MKAFIVILFLILLSNLNSQTSFNINRNIIEFSGPSSREFTYFPVIISNITSTKQTYTWKRTYFKPQSDWKLFTWDSGNRYGDTVNNNEFTLEPNEINTFVCEVQPHGFENTATIYYEICNKSDTYDCATLVYIFKTSLFTNIEDVKDNSLIIGWQLFDVYGRFIHEFNSYPTLNELNSYSTGVYFLVNYKHKKYIKIIN